MMETSFRRVGANYVLLVERRLQHPAEKVWQALTEPDLLAQWFPAPPDGEWVVGAALHFTFPPDQANEISDQDLRGQVMVVDPPRRLEFRWGASTIKFEVADVGEGCVFRLSEIFGDASWGAKSAAGWEMCVANLSLTLAGGAALEFAADVWHAKYHVYAAQFEPDFGPQEDPSEHDPMLRESKTS